DRAASPTAHESVTCSPRIRAQTLSDARELRRREPRARRRIAGTRRPRPGARMHSPRAIKRVVVVVTDALRPDAIEKFDLVSLRQLHHHGASTLAATTVQPSVTAAAMTSLLTGVAPDVHGLQSDRFHIPKPRGPILPLPRALAAAGFPSTA